MAILIKDKPIIKKAETDIICFKVYEINCFSVIDPHTFFSFSLNKRYNDEWEKIEKYSEELGYRVMTKFDWLFPNVDDAFEYGVHENFSASYRDIFVYKCTIPKGAQYYKGVELWQPHSPCFASKSLIINQEINRKNYKIYKG